ncbi:MAG: leucine-rich repeat protein, partial [Alistipes sp.]|nr:leucine-rich repeat protein [Alistipes sp.]
WTLSEVPSWVGATKTTDGIAFAVEANSSTDSRTAEFTITATNESGTAEARVELFQDGIVIPEPELALSSDDSAVTISDNGLSAAVAIAAEGAEIAIAVQTNVAAPVIEGMPEWLDATFEDSVLTLDIAANTSIDIRTAAIRVTAENRTGVIEAAIDIVQAGVAAAELTLSESAIEFSGDGETRSVEFATNQPVVEIAAPAWLTVDKGDESFTLTAAANTTGAARSGEVTVTAGTGANTATATVAVSQERQPSTMVFVVATTASVKKLTLPTLSTADAEVAITVDWGDGSDVEVFTAGLTASNAHEYADEGEYTVTIASDNTFTAFQFYNNARLKAIVKNSLDMSGVKTLSRCFYNDRALESVPADMLASCTGATAADNMFYGCIALKSIPDGFFAPLTLCKTFANCFQNCAALETIPAGMFEGSIATNFNSIFNGSGIKALPARCFAGCTATSEMKNICTGCKQLETIAPDAFEGCTKITTFYNAFSSCESLKAIPVTLFASCTGLNELDYCFQRCTGLTSLPAGMFDNNRSIRWMEYCFQRCENLTGETPYTVIDGNKIHLYEREFYPDYFLNPSSHDYCFSYDELLDDYA